MKNLIKKGIIYSMLGIIQLGIGASVIEASPRHNLPPIQQHDNRQDQDQGQDRQRHERERIENERHERDMKRRPHESEREWQERKNHENEQHEENLRRIAHDVLEIILDK